MKYNQGGFTLIEVLIASFIMFIALATFTMVFRGALLSSERAESVVSTSAYTDLIVDKISASLKQQHKKTQAGGQGMLLGRQFFWQAHVKQVSRPPARYFGGSLEQASHTIKLWQVKLTVKTNTSAKDFTYEEVTW